jgi:hypothetical protein
VKGEVHAHCAESDKEQYVGVIELSHTQSSPISTNVRGISPRLAI